MSDINFLANQKNAPKKKRSDKGKEREIKWTNPDKNNVSYAKDSDNKKISGSKSGKFDFFGLLSFLKKKKNDKESARQEQPERYRQEKPKPVVGSAINEPAAPERNKAEEKKGHGFSLWKEKFPSVEKIPEKPAPKPAKKGINAKSNEKRAGRAAPKDAETENKKQWEKADILETNLIKGELASFFNWKKGILVLAVYSVLSALVVAGLYGGLLFWERQIKKEGNEYSSRIRDLDERVIKPLEEEAKKILAEQEKIKLAEYVLRKHIYWTNFFKFLEDNTLTEVYYTSSFSGDINGEYVLPARAKDFKTILEQVSVMRANDNVKKATVSGGSVVSSAGGENEKDDVGGVNFKLDLSINPSIFTK